MEAMILYHLEKNKGQTIVNKKLILILLILVVAMFFLSGCTADALRQPVDPANGLWDKYFVYPITLVLAFFAKLFGGNYGISIIITTLIVRLLLLPLMMKQIQSTKIMNKIQPELNKIREQYKDDKTKMNEEYMKKLQENKANPFAGCLPLIVNMFVLIALYHAIMRNTAIAETTFLTIPLGETSVILPILAGIATYIQTKTAKQVATTPQAVTQQKMLMYLMPAFIIFICLKLPAALALYWVVGNTFGIIQNLIVYRDIQGPVVRNKKGNIQKEETVLQKLSNLVSKELMPKDSGKQQDKSKSKKSGTEAKEESTKKNKK